METETFTASVISARHWIDHAVAADGAVIVGDKEKESLAALGQEFDRLLEVAANPARALASIKSEKKSAASRANGAKSKGKPGARKPEGELSRSGAWRRRQREKKQNN